MKEPWWVRLAQYSTIALMWGFGIGVLIFVPWLLVVANRWHDAMNWSIVIALVMMPVYVTVAATLTYVFVSLQRGKGNSDD